MAKKKHSAPAIGAANPTGAAPVTLENPTSRGGRLFAPCILDYGNLASMRGAGSQLTAMSTAQRHMFIEELHKPKDDVEAFANRLIRTASSEIDAHQLIERARSGRSKT